MRTKSYSQLNNINKISSFQIPNIEVTLNKKKKIILSRTNIPKINIRIDSLIKETFHNISTGKSKNYTEGKSTECNLLFMEYIKSIYQIYGIENPLSKYRKLSSKQVKDTKYNQDSTKSKINQNNSRIKEISFSTILKTETRNKRQKKSKINERKTQPTQQIYNLTKSRILDLKKSANLYQKNNSIENNRKIKTYRKFQQRRENKTNLKQRYNQSNKKQELYQFTQIKRNLKKNSIQGKTTEIPYYNNSSKSKNNLIFGTPDIKQRQSSQSQIQNLTDKIDSFSLKMNQVFETKQTTPIFRYCFMCQNMILEQNILFHQKKCPDFQNLYTVHPQIIVRILIKKIQRIKEQIEEILLENQQHSIEKIKSNMNKWMSCVQNSYRNGNFNKQYQQSYRKLNSGFNINFFKLLQLSHKLKWFLKIRQQLKIKFQI